MPASLQPATTQFDHDPATEEQQVEQAALEATGKSSFYSTTTASDSTSQSSIEAQDQTALYGAAAQYAEQNNVALGTQLSAAQLAQVTAPMLWYTEQTVPVPGCTATGNAVCPTTQALMPEVLLPQNYTSVSADGEISGSNVTLNDSNSILNTGSVTAQSLSVTTNSLTNEERSTNIGASYQDAGLGAEETTGTLVQQGGYLSAQNLTINAQSIDAIGGAIQQLNADGSVDAAGTAQLLANLSAMLGSNFKQSTASNNLQNTFIAPPSDGFGDVFMMVVMVAISIILMQPEMLPALMAAIPGVVAGGALATGLAAAATGVISSAVGQEIGTGSVNWNSALETGAVSGLTAGLTQEFVGGSGLTQVSNGVTQGNSAVTLANLQTTAINVGERSLISAAVQTTIEGGSFGTALEDSVVSNAAAVGANAIGNANLSPAESVLAHAALGCVASAAEGTGCGGGAIGGATSALLTPQVLSAMDPNNEPLTTGQTATATVIAMLAGSGIAAALGQNATDAATSAANETLNNSAQHLLKAIICIICNLSSPLSINAVEEPIDGGMTTPEDVNLINNGNENGPLPRNSFGQKPK